MAPKKRTAAGTAKPAAAEPPIFVGCRVWFWRPPTHSKIMQQRLQQLGGTLQPALAADTTHVICQATDTAAQAARDLQGFAG